MGARFFTKHLLVVLFIPVSAFAQIAPLIGPHNSRADIANQSVLHETQSCSRSESTLDQNDLIAELSGVATSSDPQRQQLLNIYLNAFQNAQQRALHDHESLFQLWSALSEDELISKFNNARQNLEQSVTRICALPRRPDTRYQDRTQGDCDLLTRLNLIIQNQFSNSSTLNNPHQFATQIRNFLEPASPPNENYNFNNFSSLQTAARTILFSGLSQQQQQSVWNNLAFRHTTADGTLIVNNGYTLGGGRITGRGITYDCSDFVNRTIFGESTQTSPNVGLYQLIARELVNTEPLPESRRWASIDSMLRERSPDWVGLQYCFEAYTPSTLAEGFQPADIVILNNGSNHMIVVEAYDPFTNTIKTVEAASTEAGLTRARRALGTSLVPECALDNTSSTQYRRLSPIGSNSYILRYKLPSDNRCPAVIRDHIDSNLTTNTTEAVPLVPDAASASAGEE